MASDKKRNVVFHALSNPPRRQIIGLLEEGPYNLSTLAESLGFARPTTLTHLRQLQDAGIVERVEEKHRVDYRLRLGVRVAVKRMLELADKIAGDKSSRKKA